jgi:hypothetical protein
MWINVNTGKIFTTYSEIRQDCAGVSFPTVMDDGMIGDYGYSMVVPAVPTYNPSTQKITETHPTQVNGVWTQSWNVVDMNTTELAREASNFQEAVVIAVQERLDSFAQTRNYDSILSACTYATSMVPKFKAEGQYCVDARDAAWSGLYTLLANVQAGTTPMPASVADVLATLPVLTWPI